MKPKSIWLAVIGIAGIGCLLVGIFLVFGSPQSSNQTVTQTSQTVTVPLADFYSSGWDYGPTVEYAGKPNPVGVWMGGAGEIVYHFNLQSEKSKLTAILSSELYIDKTNAAGDGTSDVEVLVNGKQIATQNVVRDNERYGEQYSWTIPKGFLKIGANEITFRVKQNGLNVWTINGGALQLDK